MSANGLPPLALLNSTSLERTPEMSTTTSRTSGNSSSRPHTTSRKDSAESERTPRASSASGRSIENFGNDRTVWNFLAEIGRQQFAVAAECTSAMYRGSENLRKIQLETAHEASVRHGQAAEKLYGHGHASDVLPIQSELLRSDLQSATQYWQQLMVAAMQMQREMMASMSHMLENEKGDSVKSALDALQANVPAMASSFFVNGSNRQDEQQHDA
jgi:Phasin protein